MKSFILCILPLLIYQLFVSLFLNLSVEHLSQNQSIEDALWINAWQFAAMIPNRVAIEPYRLILAPLYHHTISHLISNLMPLALLFYAISRWFDANNQATHWHKIYAVLYAGGILSCFGSFVFALTFDLPDWRAGISGGLFACCAYALCCANPRLSIMLAHFWIIPWLLLVIWAIAPFSSVPIDRLSHLFGLVIGFIMGLDQRMGGMQRNLKLLGNAKWVLIGLICLQITALGDLGLLMVKDGERWQKIGGFQRWYDEEGECQRFEVKDLIAVRENGLIGICLVGGGDMERGGVVKDLSDDQKGGFRYLLLRDDSGGGGVRGGVVSKVKLTDEMVLRLIFSH